MKIAQIAQIAQIALYALLAGCAETPVKSQTPEIPIVAPTTVYVPVRERCAVALPAAPAWDTERVAQGASPFEQSKAVLAELERRRAYEVALRAEAKKCE